MYDRVSDRCFHPARAPGKEDKPGFIQKCKIEIAGLKENNWRFWQNPLIMKSKMRKRLFSFTCGFLFSAVVWCPGQTPYQEAEIWQKAVALRTESFTFAPALLYYEQYHIDKDGKAGQPETGCFGLAYDEGGKAAISVVWAKRGEKDFTIERSGRLEKQSSRRTEFLQYFTPFDPDLQSKLTRTSGKQVFEDGKLLWQYGFSLPLDKRRSFKGTVRVDSNGRPHDYRFTLSPLPFFMDIMDVQILFDSAAEHLIFSRINFVYEASFLFWTWKGGGSAGFDGWKRISAPPRLF